MPAPWPALTSRGVSPTAIVALEVERRAGDRAAALERLLGQLGAIARVGAVAAEGEEAVEVGAGELDPWAADSMLPVTMPEQRRPRSARRGRISSIPGITR